VARGAPLRRPYLVRGDVDPHPCVVCADSFGGQTSDQPGATRDIEDAFTRLQVGRTKQFPRDRYSDVWHEVTLIVLGGRAGEMLIRDRGHARTVRRSLP